MQLVWNVTRCCWANSSDILKGCGACISKVKQTNSSETLWPWRWRWLDPCKCWCLSV